MNLRRFVGAFRGGFWITAAWTLALAASAATADQPAHAIALTNLPAWTPGATLTCEQAVQRALACDCRIASLNATVEVARQQRRAATDIKDPVIQGESRSLGRSDTAASDELDNSRVSVGVFIPNPWLTFPRMDARTADYEAARADLAAATWQVRCDVQRLFAELNFLTNDLVFSANRVRLNNEVLQAVQARVGQGAATASDLMTASRQFLQFQDDLDQTTHRYDLARRQLALMLDAPSDAFAIDTNSFRIPAEPANLNFATAAAMAVKSRGDLAALRWRAAAAVSDYHEVRNQQLPWIKEVKAGFLNHSDEAWVGVAMDVPIFSWVKNHASDAAHAKAGLASVEATNGLRLARQQLHDALDQVEQTRRQQARNETTVQPLIATMQQTITTLTNTPNIMAEQVAAAELELVETLRYDLNSRWQHDLALLELQRAIGAPLNQIASSSPTP